MDKQIIRFIRTVLIPGYWDAKGGRSSSHLRDVLAAARRLVGRELNGREYLTIALHDIGVGRKGFTRDEHPRAFLAALEEDEALQPIRHLVDQEMSDAVVNHMSDCYKRVGILSPLHQLLVEADEGVPVWGRQRIVKPVKYWLDGRGMPLDTPIDDVVGHVKAVLLKKVKSFQSGTAPFTERYVEVFRKEIAAASAWAIGVTEDDILAVIGEERSKRVA